MRISLAGPAFHYMDPALGYGQAASAIYKSLINAGLNVEINSKSADIELCFSHPAEVEFHDRTSYKIMYSAWESTSLNTDWIRNMSKADEIWATSDWVGNVWRELFPDKYVHVYKHGINPMWKPVLRQKANKPFTFLHIGEPFSRKDAQLATDCFIELFGENPDYRLILKGMNMNTVRVQHPTQGWYSSPSAIYENIITINQIISDEEMIDLYSKSDVFVYPSWGEGWGFQPMQSLAMGIPTITTVGWCDYSKYVTFPVDSRWMPSPWVEIHPGYMMKPEKDHLKEQMLSAVENYDKVLKPTFRNALEMHKEYDWEIMTRPAIKRFNEIYHGIQERQENLSKLDLRNSL